MIMRKIHERRATVIALVIVPLLCLLMDVPLKATPRYQDKPRVQNVNLEIRQEIAIITYDLVSSDTDTYEISAALLKEGDSRFRIPIRSATGDIGQGKFGGTKRQIQWEWRKDLPKDFKGGSEYSVEVSATRIEGGGGSSWLYYVLGGALIAGGVVVLVGGKKSGDQSVSTAPLPSTPPGRPF